MTNRLALEFDYSSYSFSEMANASYVETKGGFARSRDDLSDTSILISLQFTLNEIEYQNFQLFWRVGTNEGQDNFTIPLIIDNADLTDTEASFSASPSLTKVVGLNYTIAATFEVTPQPASDDFDGSIIALYASSNGDPVYGISLLNQIVNINWPQA